jgi:hypothetical protein
MATVLSLMQDFCEKQGLPVPTALVGSQEKSVRQLKALMNDLAQELSQYRWQQQRIRKTWSSVAGQDQGTLVSIFGAGYESLVANTLWNSSRQMRIYGPVADSVWQAMQVLPNAGPEFQCWVAGGKLYVSPALLISENLSALYTTKYGVLSSGGTAQERILADSDTFLFPEIVVARGIEYKWRKAKGEPGWEDDFNAYSGLIAKNIVKDGATTLRLDNPAQSVKPGIIVPAGSWNV